MPKVSANTVIKTIHQTTAALQAHARTLFVCTSNQRQCKYVLLPRRNMLMWMKWIVTEAHARTLFVFINNQCECKYVSIPPKNMLMWIKWTVTEAHARAQRQCKYRCLSPREKNTMV